MDDLIVPAQLARLHVERQHRRGVEIVALPGGPAEHRHRIAGVDVYQAQVGVDRGRVPHATPALLPDLSVLLIALRRPGVSPCFAGAGNRVELPELLAGLGVERDHLASEGPVAVGQSGEDHAAGIHGRSGDGLPRLGRRVAELRRPHELSGALLQGGDAPVHEPGKHHPVTKRHARGIRNPEPGIQQVADTGRLEPLGRFLVRTPDPLAVSGLGVEGVQPGPGGDEHHAVLHDRGGARGGIAVESHRPTAAKVLHVLRRDLGERGMALVGPVPAEKCPVLARRPPALVLGLHQHRDRDAQPRRDDSDSNPARIHRHVLSPHEMSRTIVGTRIHHNLLRVPRRGSWMTRPGPLFPRRASGERMNA